MIDWPQISTKQVQKTYNSHKMSYPQKRNGVINAPCHFLKLARNLVYLGTLKNKQL